MKPILVIILVFLIPFLAAGQEVLELSIEEAVETAIKNNDLIKAEKFKIKEAETIKAEAFSHFLPKVDAAVMKLLKEKPMIVEFPSMVPGDPPSRMELSFTRDYTVAFQASQPLFLGGQIFYNWKIADKNLELSNLKYQEQLDNLVFQVKSTYYLCFIFEKVLEAVREGLELSREHFEKVDSFYKAGTATYQEWLRAKVQLSNLDPELHQAESNLISAFNTLKLLLGVQSDIKLTSRLNTEGDLILDADRYRDKINANLQLIGIKKAIDMAEYQRRISWGDYLPKLSISMDYSLGSDEFKFGRGYWDENYSINLNIQLSIFDGFAKHARRKRADYSIKALEHQSIFYEKSIKNELDQLLNDIETSIKKTGSYRDNLEDSRESVRVSRLYYEEGLITSFEVNASNLDYTRARINYLNAVYDYYISVFKLEKLIPRIDQ